MITTVYHETMNKEVLAYSERDEASTTIDSSASIFFQGVYGSLSIRTNN